MDRPEIQVNDYCWLENCVVKVMAPVNEVQVMVAHNETVKPYTCDLSMLRKLTPEEVEEYLATKEATPVPEQTTVEVLDGDEDLALLNGTAVKIIGRISAGRVVVVRPGYFHGFTVGEEYLQDMDPKQKAQVRCLFEHPANFDPVDESDVPGPMEDVPVPAEPTADPKNLNQELVRVLNCFSRENASDTPDTISAQYLLWCLEAFENVSTRKAWYGRRTTDEVVHQEQPSPSDELPASAPQGQVLYAIGCERDGSFSEFTHGPTPTLQDMMDERGENARTHILQLNGDGSATPLYQWDTAINNWVQIGG